MNNVAASPEPAPALRKRRWWKVAVGFLAFIVVLIVALPFLLGTPPARRWLIGKANDALGPGVLTVDQLRLSWFRPTILNGLAIRDEDGHLLVSAPRAIWDRNLFQAIFDRPRLGTILLEGAGIEIERRSDRTIDLIEFLKPILQGKPETDLTVRLVDGSLRFRSPELDGPIVAKDFDLLIRRPAAPAPISWLADLSDPDGRTLRLDGNYDRWDGKSTEQSGLTIGIEANRWPVAIQAGDLDIRAEISRTMSALRTDGLWSLDSTLVLDGCEVSGQPLNGDRVKLEQIAANFGLDQKASSWSIRTLDVQSPLGSLKATGPIPAESGERHRLVGKLDLVAMASLLPETLGWKDGLMLDRGLAELSIQAETEGPTRRWTAEASVVDLAGHVGKTSVALRQPASFVLQVSDRGDSVTVEALTFRSAFLNVDGQGDLDAGVKVAGTLNLAALVDQSGDFVDLKRVGLIGSGPIAADLRRDAAGHLVGHLSLEFETASAGPSDDPIAIQGLKFSASANAPSWNSPRDWTTDLTLGVTYARRDGLDLGPTEIRLRYEPGSLVVDPISTTLNGGTLCLVPEFDLKASPALFRLMPGTELRRAEVNEEATRRVLAFVAPVLEGATRASGKVSARIDLAQFPIDAKSLEEAVVEGNVVFDDVVFTPGPMSRELLSLLNRDDTTLMIDQPVVLSIAEGRIHQSGFNVPIGDVTSVSIEGTVGFDKTLDLEASMPITPAMFPNRGLIGDMISGTRVSVPIGGTLDKPSIDRAAFREAMLDVGREMLLRSATQGAASMLFRLTQPRDPNAPKPPTAAERKAKRLEKKLERRGG